MSDNKMQTNPYGIEDRKVKIKKIMSQKEKKEYDKKYGIGLYIKGKDKSEKPQTKQLKANNKKFYGYTNIKKY